MQLSGCTFDFETFGFGKPGVEDPYLVRPAYFQLILLCPCVLSADILLIVSRSCAVCGSAYFFIDCESTSINGNYSLKHVFKLDFKAGKYVTK